MSTRGYLNILDWLQGRVAGLQVYTARNNDRIPYIRNSRAGIYVDEIYRDADFLNSLPVTDIAMIKIIKGPFAGGFNSPGGVIAIYTIGTDDEGEETDD
jgi:outer membrane receptor protein involved in Fe transport